MANMKFANNIRLTVFAKPEEDAVKIKEKLASLIPFSLEQEKIQIKESKATSFNDREIRIFEIFIEKESHTNLFIDNILSRLSIETKELLIKQLDSRIDNECNLFLRFSKDRFNTEGNLWLTDQGNCFHIKINLACFPKKKENAIAMAKDKFNMLLTH